MKPLANKIALITGASRGIGEAIATRLAADGAEVILHFGAGKDEANAVAQKITASGGKARTVQADFTKPDAASQLFSQLKGVKLDILVNNAGVAPFADIESTTPEMFDQLASVNMRSLFFVTQAALRQFNDGGRIVNVSSAVTRIYFPGIPAYSATKGFVDTLTMNLAAALGPRGITVNAVAPGAIDTRMSAWIHQPGGVDMLKQIQALPGIGQPVHVANAVAYLVSPDAAWTTGTSVDVSGGTKL
jgi:3-oxoacyl-[acyl-carrier protein] reductase